MISVRCSSLPRITICPVSALPASAQVNWSNPFSRLCSATHEAFSAFQADCVFDLDDITKAYRVETDDLCRSFNFLLSAWRQVSDWFPDPICETSLQWADDNNGITLTGTPDFVSLYSPDELRVGDWKAGFLDRDCGDQLRGYALLAMKTHSRTAAHAMQINTRLRGGEGWRWTLEELETWWDDLAKKVSLAEHFPAAPGPHCEHCPRWAECPAGREHLRQAAAFLLMLSEAGELVNLPPSALFTIHENRSLVQKACEHVQSLLKKEVGSRGGRILSSDGKRSLELTESTTREISFREAETVLRGRLPAFVDCIEVGKGMLEKAVKAGAPRGEKAAAWDATMEALDAAGAVNAYTTNKLQIKRIDNQNGETL